MFSPHFNASMMEMLEPRRRKLRTETVDPICAETPNKEMEEPRRVPAKTESWEPNRTMLRRERALPKLTLSNTLRDFPPRDAPATENSLPKRRKDRNEQQDPRVKPASTLIFSPACKFARRVI
jgi:hypothetical protein